MAQVTKHSVNKAKVLSDAKLKAAEANYKARFARYAEAFYFNAIQNPNVVKDAADLKNGFYELMAIGGGIADAMCSGIMQLADAYWQSHINDGSKETPAE